MDMSRVDGPAMDMDMDVSTEVGDSGGLSNNRNETGNHFLGFRV